MRLVIDRKLWTRCHYDTTNSKGELTHCAVGFYRQKDAAAFDRLDGVKVEAPARPCPCRCDERREWTLHGAIVHVNDCWPAGPEREQKLIDLFGKVGVDVEFIN